MTGSLLPVPGLRAVDANGAPLPGALLSFYLSGTTTPTPVYANASLTTPLSNPVVADSTGLFPAIYVDPTITYRAILMTGAAVLVRDTDPVATPSTPAAGSVTGAMLASGAAVANLGFTPVNKAGDSATNLSIYNTTFTTNSAGYLFATRNTQNANYSFALTDAGNTVVCDTTGGFTWTIPTFATVGFPPGAVILVRNRAPASLTLARGSGGGSVVLRIAGSATSKDVSLAQWGFASLVCDALNEWVCSGTGVS